MRPYLLKGHSRPLTQVKFNREGDLLVSCAKDSGTCLWWAEDGKRMGTYDGHSGAVYSCDITWDSDRLLTASADSSVKLWELNTGKDLFTFKRDAPCVAVKLAVGDSMFAFTTAAFMAIPPTINIVRLESDLSEQSSKPVLTIEGPKGRITRVVWTDMNRTLVTCHEKGMLRRWDVETGKMLQEAQVHEDDVMDMQTTPDELSVITASLDKTSKLVDIETFEVLKTYKTGRFVNSAAVSPIVEHVLLGGGQDASQVTTTSSKAGGFEARFFHKIYQEEFGMVRGHFGPINSVAFSPNGRSFATGGEDGYVRLHHLDMDYFTAKYF